MMILAIDSANFHLSIALLQGKEILAYAENKTSVGDAVLLPMIEALFQKASLPLRAMTHVAVTLGPGSFTGTRIGIAAARGLALALEIPILAVNSFEWVAHCYKKLCPHHLDSSLVVALESKREESFVALFSKELKLLREETYLRPDQLHEYIGAYAPVVVGDAASYIDSSMTSWMPNAQDLAFHVQEKLAYKRSFETCVPFYLRPPEINRAKK